MKNTLKNLMAGAVTAGLFALPVVVGATGGINAANCGTGEGQIPCVGELGLGNATLGQLVTGIITLIMGLLGIVAVLIILWGGFIWMTAAGEPDKVEKAKKLIYAGIIGLVVIFAAYAIATFVWSTMAGLTNASFTP
jgi:hypothetical protein